MQGKIRVGKKSIHLLVNDTVSNVRDGQYIIEVAMPINGYARSAIIRALQYGDVAKTIARRGDIVTMTFMANIRTVGTKLVIDIPQAVALALAKHGDIRNKFVIMRILGTVKAQ